MRKNAIIILTCAAAISSCRHDNEAWKTTDSDIVVEYRDTVLRMSDIIRQLPAGISNEDSARLITTITDEWIDGFLIEDLAAGQIDDLDRINDLAARYRRSLIADSYRRKMRMKGVQPVDMESVKAYYKAHSNELKLERPIVKGLFIKVPASSRHLDEIRYWMKNAGPDTYDELENIGRKEATRFRYFDDEWVDFDAIAAEIPYRFGSADKFVEENTDFETELNGTVYIIHLTDHRKGGALMPEEYAAPLIEDRMKSLYLADYEDGLIRALRKTAIEKNILKEGTFSIYSK